MQCFLHNTKFQSTHPVRGATVSRRKLISWLMISIHAPRAGCDWQAPYGTKARRYFNPRTPCGVRLACASPPLRRRKFQSTHPVRGATKPPANNLGFSFISIHAPRAGCDLNGFPAIPGHFRISIHAPRAGCDPLQVVAISRNTSFQSTHPVRGATRGRSPIKRSLIFQSTHPVRGATRRSIRRQYRGGISIHAPRAGCDLYREGGAVDITISIHAPRAGCDLCRQRGIRPRNNFNPRTPCGVRRMTYNEVVNLIDFNPRTPCGVRPHLQ